MIKKLTQEFIEKWLDFDSQLREKQGLNEALLSELIELLIDIKALLEGSDSIPKSLAEIFVDIWGAMTSCADVYEHDIKDKIYEAADHLACHARGICIS